MSKMKKVIISTVPPVDDGKLFAKKFHQKGGLKPTTPVTGVCDSTRLRSMRVSFWSSFFFVKEKGWFR